MHPDLVKLLELQAKDAALLEADRALDLVLADLQALDQELVGAEQAVEQAERAVADATRRRIEIEGKIENYKKLDERGRQRLELIKTPREVQAVMTELDLARSVLAKEEADWVRQSDTVTGLQVAAKEATARLEQLRETQVAQRAELEQRQAEAGEVREAALAERDEVAGQVERALRTRYERLRSVRRVVVVALDGAACGACFTTVPLNRRSQIRAGTLIDTCESCGVILYSSDSVE